MAARWEISPTCWAGGRAQLAPTGEAAGEHSSPLRGIGRTSAARPYGENGGRAQLAPTGKRRASTARVVGVKSAFAPASHSAPSAPFSCPFSPNRTRFAGLWLGFLFFCGDRSITDCRGDLWSPAGERNSPLQGKRRTSAARPYGGNGGRAQLAPTGDREASAVRLYREAAGEHNSPLRGKRRASTARPYGGNGGRAQLAPTGKRRASAACPYRIPPGYPRFFIISRIRAA